MQVIILAAGMGKRLKTLTARHTKAMVSILGKTFLEHSLDNLTQFPLSRIILVIGYCGEEIKTCIGNSYKQIPVIYVENPLYETTNNIYSLYLTKNYCLEDDTLLLESDLIYEKNIITKVLDNPYPDLAVVAKYQSYMDGTVVKINDQDEITEFISQNAFDYTQIDGYYKTVNIYKLSKEFMHNHYIPFLEAYCTSAGYNSYYEYVLKTILSLENIRLKALRLDQEKWYEVDDLNDYDIAESLFSHAEEKFNSYSKRYGGYWRFTQLKDFCYLVNPYFPPKRLLEELQNNVATLLTQYPSGQAVQQRLAANVFCVDEDMLLVGNGAAECINALLPELEGRIGIILPTFQEYPARCSERATVHFFTPANDNFSYTAKDLQHFSRETDTLLLINPDNPSGNFLPKADVLALATACRDTGKTLILDESFVDFSEEMDNNSLLDSTILRSLPNLIVIKSISKSYGVPGLRLGIMATANTALLQRCRKNVPVWNINAYAEFFLQIVNKYKAQYRDACRNIALLRKEFLAQLDTIPFLRPIPSQANYILCEVLPPFRSDSLSRRLLDADILIKDCRNKPGCTGRNYIRLAIKSREDNHALIQLLASYGSCGLPG